MPKNKPIQAVGLNWKKNVGYIGGIQVIFSNGVTSPLFLAKNQEGTNLQKIEINSEIKKIRGTNNAESACSVIF